MAGRRAARNPARSGDAAEVEGLLELGARVAFRHSLLRSAIYQAAGVHERRIVHGALAAATDPAVDPDRRAWHRAHATIEPDEDVATELERSAGRAQARGGLPAAAAFLERAAALTPDPPRRARRALNAAQAKQLSGAPQAALAMLAAASAGPLDALDRAKLQRLRGQIALDLRKGSDAVPLLVDAAVQLESLDPGLARQTYLEALRSASIAGRLGGGMRDTAQAARHAPPSSGAPPARDLLLDAGADLTAAVNKRITPRGFIVSGGECGRGRRGDARRRRRPHGRSSDKSARARHPHNSRWPGGSHARQQGDERAHLAVHRAALPVVRRSDATGPTVDLVRR